MFSMHSLYLIFAGAVFFTLYYFFKWIQHTSRMTMANSLVVLLLLESKSFNEFVEKTEDLRQQIENLHEAQRRQQRFDSKE